jgi:biotin carboxylase
MKKIMILGGSNCQKNAVLHGKSLGYEVFIADYAKSPLAACFADGHIEVSTFDPEGCIRAAREIGAGGIMTMGTDQPVLTAALIAEALHLPSAIGSKEAKSVTNKKIMKAIFKANQIPSVNYKLIHSDSSFDDIKELTVPVVLKPLDSQGQRGVFRLDDKNLVFHYLDQTLSFSREKEALLEEYYPSDEITVSGWIQNSSLTILTITDRILLQDPVHIGICTSHRFPSVHMGNYKEIKEISEKIVKAFHLTNGPLYIQMLIGEKGLMVNEVAARIGGAFEDVIIKKIGGFDILDAVMRISLGMEVDAAPLQDFDCSKSSAEASVQLMFASPGIPSSITPVEQLLKLEHVIDAGYNYKQRDEIKPIKNATARFGHCVLFTDSGPIAPSVDLFQRNFKILDEKGNNLYKVL